MHVDNLQFAGMVFKFVSVQHPPSRCIGLQLSRTEQYSNSQSGSEGILGDLKDVSRRPWNIEGWKEWFEERAESNGLLKNLEAAQKRAEEGETERAELEGH
ncbi:hypothetical protein F5888DRAFT_1641220 [Russula emetica]|nr:hypothetical protein F5888DRAFT_1641220 [Russula emetica]